MMKKNKMEKKDELNDVMRSWDMNNQSTITISHRLLIATHNFIVEIVHAYAKLSY